VKYVKRIELQLLYLVASRDLKLSHLSIHATEPNPFSLENIHYSHLNTSSSRYFHTAQHPTYPLSQSHQSYTNPQMANIFVTITYACRRTGISYLAYLYIHAKRTQFSLYKVSRHCLIHPPSLSSHLSLRKFCITSPLSPEITQSYDIEGTTWISALRWKGAYITARVNSER
jgi:hypothetical protein